MSLCEPWRCKLQQQHALNPTDVSVLDHGLIDTSYSYLRGRVTICIPETTATLYGKQGVSYGT